MTNDHLLNAALCLVEEKGLEGLTLRPLAERLGVSVSALSHRFGQKSDILSMICAMGAMAEQRIFDCWRLRVGHDCSLGRAQLANVVDSVMSELSGPYVRLVRLQGELMQAATLRDELRPVVRQWVDLRYSFWSFLVERLDDSPAFDLAAVLNGYAVDELAYGVALGEDGAYRWLRRLCLGRLCEGVIAPDQPGESWDMQSFSAVWLELGESQSQLFETEAQSKTALTLAGHVAHMLLTRGADGITYRSVGREADMAPSSVAYHFPRQDSLLRAGLEHIIRSARAQTSPTKVGVGHQLVANASTVARATHALALAIARYPDLRPFVADMRRRRGENGVHHLRIGAVAADRIDRLTAQVVSVASMGSLMLQRATGEDGEPEVVTELFDFCRSAGKL